MKPVLLLALLAACTLTQACATAPRGPSAVWKGKHVAVVNPPCRDIQGNAVHDCTVGDGEMAKVPAGLVLR